MRNKKLQRQLSKNLDYDEVETDLPQLIEWAKSHQADGAMAENALKVFENLSAFLDVVQSSYELSETNLNNAQRSLEVSGVEIEERNKALRVENKKFQIC